MTARILPERTAALALTVMCCAQAASAVETWTVASPSGKVVFSLWQDGGKGLLWRVDRDGKAILAPSRLGMRLRGETGALNEGLRFISRRASVVHETWTAISGRRSRCVNRANETVFRFLNRSSVTLELVVRAYDEGVAFRYRVPQMGQYSVLEETTEYVTPAGTTAWAQKWRSHYEHTYDAVGFDELVAGEWGHPLLLNLPRAGWALLAEAHVDSRYAALHFAGAGKRAGDGVIKLVFPPDQKTPITGKGTLATPWRVVICAEELAPIVESDMIRNLNPPSRIREASWIKPGRVAWSWWSDRKSPRSYDTQKRFVDFAAEMGWEYVLVDEGWPSWQKLVPDLVKYARNKNVRILLWKYSRDVTDDHFRKWSDWGIAGVKFDFIQSDSQEAFGKTYDPLLEMTARHRLLVNFHGCTKPAGETRTWPHNLTREAVKGGEYRHVSADSSINLVFTRNVIGPMDFTPVILSQPDGWLETTYGHQLSHAVLFESGLQHFPDSPKVYRASPAKGFLKAVPAAWDDTKLIAGRPDKLVILARRKGRDWYVGVATGGKATSRSRERVKVEVPLSFLDANVAYDAMIWRDGQTRTQIDVDKRRVTAKDIIELKPLAGGGCVIRMTPRDGG